MNKDVVDDKLLPVGEDEENGAKNGKGQGDNLGGAHIEAEASVEEVIKPL